MSQDCMKRVDLSTQDCMKLYVSSADSINPCPTHTSDSSACAGYGSSFTILLAVSERQAQTKFTNLWNCLVVFNWKESNKCDLCQACQLLITYLCDKGSGCRTLLGAVATLMKCGRDGQRFRKNYSSVWRPAPVNFKKRIDLRLVSPFPNGGNERILELASVNLRFSTIIYDDLPLSTIIYVQR